MFNINDTVMHTYSGVCTISDITARKNGLQQVEYYVLKPIYDCHSTIYCPTDNSKNLIRPLLTKQEILNLIDELKTDSVEWISNDFQRKEYSASALKSGNPKDIIRLVRMLFLHRKEVEKNGRKIHTTDERSLKDAQELICGEIAFVMQINRSEVANFIEKESLR